MRWSVLEAGSKYRLCNESTIYKSDSNRNPKLATARSVFQVRSAARSVTPQWQHPLHDSYLSYSFRCFLKETVVTATNLKYSSRSPKTNRLLANNPLLVGLKRAPLWHGRTLIEEFERKAKYIQSGGRHGAQSKRAWHRRDSASRYGALNLTRGPGKLQLRTTKHDNIDISWSRFFWGKLTSDSDSARRIRSKKAPPKFFPRLFRVAKIFEQICDKFVAVFFNFEASWG